MTIAILDDEPDRIDEMRRCLASCISCEVVVFDNAPDMIGWLSENLASVHLICLDHDLGANRIRDGKVFDPGTGRDVANFLAAQLPVCPVIIHTTNSLAAPRMIMVLEDAAWRTEKVCPYDDLAWIQADWITQVRNLLASE